MVTSTISSDFDYEIDDMQNFERIRPQREGAMPVGRSKSAVRGRRRSKPSKRSHSTPQHCRGAAHRRIRKWR